MTLMKTFRVLLPILALTMYPSLAKAVNCGDSVNGNVILTSDLNCSSTGLTVSASFTHINLNGHTISCSGGGYGGSCQMTGGPAGIASYHHDFVEITGPGTINGFAVGIVLQSGLGFFVTNVKVTGPPQTDVIVNPRPQETVGMAIGSTSCFFPFAPIPSVVLWANDVSHHNMGIQLSQVGCAIVRENNVHDNNGPADSHGIDVIDATNSLIDRNQVHANGGNSSAGNPDSGITLLAGGSSGNTIVNNTVTGNCGNGIVAFNGAQNNDIRNNVARFNPTSLLPQCRPASVDLPKFFDLAEFNEGPGNIWNSNNKCRTQSAGIPAGVCNPGE
jgi:parallel beta-helix repeat protein